MGKEELRYCKTQIIEGIKLFFYILKRLPGLIVESFNEWRGLVESEKMWNEFYKIEGASLREIKELEDAAKNSIRINK